MKLINLLLIIIILFIFSCSADITVERKEYLTLNVIEFDIDDDGNFYITAKDKNNNIQEFLEVPDQGIGIIRKDNIKTPLLKVPILRHYEDGNPTWYVYNEFSNKLLIIPRDYKLDYKK